MSLREPDSSSLTCIAVRSGPLLAPAPTQPTYILRPISSTVSLNHLSTPRPLLVSSRILTHRVTDMHFGILALSPLVNTLGQLCGVGGRPFLQVLFQAVFTNSLRTSAQVIATALLVNTIAFSLGVPGYGSLGLYDPKLVLDLATVAVPAAILGASAGSYVPDRYLRLTYSVLAFATACSLAARARRLAQRDAARLAATATTEDESKQTNVNSNINSEAFCDEGNFLSTIDVECIDMLDESESDNEGDSERVVLQPSGYRFGSLYNIANSSVVSFCSSFTSLRRGGDSSPAVHDADDRKTDPLTQMLLASRTLSTTASSLLSMSATDSLLPTTTSTTYGTVNDQQPAQWPLLDIALTMYTRPNLTTRGKAILGAGSVLCGALGVGTAESILVVLVALHDIPLASAATAAISVAFYAQMTASVMDGVASAADASTPRIAESVPWSLVFSLLPGVVIGALVGPRLHAFVPERRMLTVAACTLFCVSLCVAIVGYAP